MNKTSLVSIALLGLVLPALAVAEGPEVYGKINLSLEHLTEEPEPAAPDNDERWVLSSNASRLGVRGGFDSDLPGLEVIYRAEFEMQVDDGDKGGQTFSQRNIYGGLQGPWGVLRGGRFDTPTKQAQLDVDRFSDLDGDIKQLMAGENRADNIVEYATPPLGGLATLKLAFMPNEDQEDFDGDGENENGLADSSSVALLLEQNGFYGALSRDTDMPDELIADSTGGDTLDITRLALGHNGDWLELGAIFQRAEESEADGEDESLLASAAMKINERLKLKGQYGITEGTESDEEVSLAVAGADYRIAGASKLFVYGAQRDFREADEQNTTLGLGFEHKF